MANNGEQSKTTTNNSNELIGGGGQGSTSPLNSFASQQRAMFPVRPDGLQRSLTEPGQTSGTMNINELRTNSRTMEGSEAMASTLAIATVSGEGGRARGRARPRARGSFMAGLLMDMERRNPSMASSGRGDGGADVGNSMDPRVDHGGMIPKMNFSGGYSGMASGLAPGLGQTGLPRPGPTGLAPAANFHAQTPASDGVVSSHGDGLNLSLTPSPVSNYDVFGSKQAEWGRADVPGEEVKERKSQKRMMEINEEAPSPRARKHGYTDNRGVIPNMNPNFGYSGMTSAHSLGLRQLGLHQAGPTGLAPALNFPTQRPASDELVTKTSQGNRLVLSNVGSYGIDESNRQEVLDPAMRRKIRNRESAEKTREKRKAKVSQLEEERNRLKEENNRLKEENNRLEEENNRLEEENHRLREENNRLSKEKESTQINIESLGSESIESPLQPDGKKKVA